jgi:hypothetical protein
MKRFAILALLIVCGCSNRFTFEKVVKLHAHQTYDDVVAVLGKPDRVKLTSQGTEKLIIAASWGPEYGSPAIFVGFEDGEVARIAVSGIEAPK